MRQGLLRVLILTGLLVTLLPYPVSADPLMVAGERWCPPETGFCAENAFYDFWRSHGALEILGYPIDQPRRISQRHYPYV